MIVFSSNILVPNKWYIVSTKLINKVCLTDKGISSDNNHIRKSMDMKHKPSSAHPKSLEDYTLHISTQPSKYPWDKHIL